MDSEPFYIVVRPGDGVNMRAALFISWDEQAARKQALHLADGTTEGRMVYRIERLTHYEGKPA